MKDIERSFKQFQPLDPGDKVAVLSPAGDAASYFPWVLDRGIERLQEHTGFEPIEYPTTRLRSPTPEERARDVNLAFADPDIKAIFTSLGGNDQVRILPYLNTKIIGENPKPFFGYSDNTNIHQVLWKLGIPSYYGGALMTQFAMQGGVQPITIESLDYALFKKGSMELPSSTSFIDIDLDWSDRSNLDMLRQVESDNGWSWDGQANGEGRLWGGCIDSLLNYISADQELPNFGNEPIVIFLESSEELPDSWVVDALVSALGEKGILHNAKAVLVGRPKAWDLDRRLNGEERVIYRNEQRKTILTRVRHYIRDIPVIQNIDFGHTDPQIIVPSGNICRVDSSSQKIHFIY